MKDSAPSRSKLLLTDINLAKKNEYERRRKLRLQQVRQQARDIACDIRKKVDVERRVLGQKENDKREKAERAATEKLKKKLSKELDLCSEAVGSSHRAAGIQGDVEAILKEKLELQEALARARGAVAAEKAKGKRQALQNIENLATQRKVLSKQAENVRSNLVKSLPPQKADVAPQQPKPQTDKLKKLPAARNEPTGTSKTALPSALKKVPGKPSGSIARPEQPQTSATAEKAIDVRRDGLESISHVTRRSPPPVRRSLTSIQCDDSDGFSDDSRETWPPRSTRAQLSLPPTVKMYNHNERKCTEYAMPSGVSLLSPPRPSEIYKMIKEEEAAAARKIELMNHKRQTAVERGQRVLAHEKNRREFDAMIREMQALDKKERIRRVAQMTSKNTTHGKSSHNTENADKDGIQDPKPKSKSNLKTPCESEPALKKLMSRLEEERKRLLISDSESDTDSEEVPQWILYKETEKTDVPPHEDEAMDQPEIPTEEPISPTKPDGNPTTVSTDSTQSSESPQSPPQPSQSVDNSPPRESSSTDSPCSGIKITVRVSDKKNDLIGAIVQHRQSTTRSETVSAESSTSYYSLPDHLSPQQKDLLNRTMQKISLKNNNPILRRYINQLLDMSRDRISNLGVSSGSDVTVPSSLFEPKLVDQAVQVELENSRDPEPELEPRVTPEEAEHLAQRIAELIRLMTDFREMGLDTEDSKSSYQSIPTVSPAAHVEWPHIELSQPDDTLFFDKSLAERILGIPSEIHPKPFDTVEPALPKTLSVIEEHPTEALSDIESIISSIQNEPPLTDSSLDILTTQDMNVTFHDPPNSSSDVEEVFKSLGLGWALSTLRRTRRSRKLSLNSSSNTDNGVDRSRSKSKTKSSSSYKHSTPVKMSPRKSSPGSSLSSDFDRLSPPKLTLINPYANR